MSVEHNTGCSPSLNANSRTRTAIASPADVLFSGVGQVKRPTFAVGQSHLSWHRGKSLPLDPTLGEPGTRIDAAAQVAGAGEERASRPEAAEAAAQQGPAVPEASGRGCGDALVAASNAAEERGCADTSNTDTNRPKGSLDVAQASTDPGLLARAVGARPDRSDGLLGALLCPATPAEDAAQPTEALPATDRVACEEAATGDTAIHDEVSHV